MINLGKVKPGSTIRIPFSSFDKDDGSSITMTNFAVGDILVYKDGSTTERASTSGFTATTDFDSKTGKHLAIIDLADNTTSGFWNAGSEYLVALDAVTVDGVNVGGWIARFTIGYDGSLIDTTIATLSSQTSFTLTSGPAENDAIKGFWAIIHDIASAVQCSWVEVSAYTGSTKTVTLAAGATFTAAAGDNISIMAPSPLRPATVGRTAVVDSAGLVDANAVKVGPTGSGTAQTAGDIFSRLPALVSGRVDASVGAYQSGQAPLQPTTAGRTLDVSTGGEAGIDWANIGSPSSTQNLSATTVKTLTDAPSDSSGVTTLLSRLTAARAGYLDVLNGIVAAIWAAVVDSSGVTTLLSRLTATRAGYLDNLSAGAVATAAQINGLAVNTRVNLNVPVEIETPDSSTQVFKIRLHLFDVEGNMEAPDSTPTIALTNAAGTDRSSRLSSASNPSTGVYTWDYTATAGDAEEQLVWVFTVVEGGATRTYPATSYVVEETAYRFTSTDRANLVAALADTNELQQDWANGGRLDNILDARASQTSVDDLPTNAELATALAGSDDATLAAIGGLNNVSAAQVQTAAAAALTAYDPPTKAEMDTAIDALPTAAENADAVWDEIITDHDDAGSTGEALAAAGSAGDPWATALPGSYTSGQAGKIIGDNINATISSRASQTSVDDVPTNAELTTALGLADDAVLAQVAAVKAKTDLLEFTDGNVSANIKAINDVEITGSGVEGDSFVPE